MAERANPDFAHDVAAAFAWWREAGVDHVFGDKPINWIEPPQEAAPRAGAGPAAAFPGDARSLYPRAEPASPTAPAIDAAALPGDLAGFTSWWLTEPLLDQGRLAGRVAPHGPAGADAMVIVPEPEKDDVAELLSGPQGRLLDAILTAMGLASGRVYVASALPRHTPMADWTQLAARGFASVLARHVELVAPRRLIVFGSNILPLLGHGLTNTGQFLPIVNHEDLSIPLFAATDLGLLLSRPRGKTRLWQQWLDWTGTETT